MNTSRLVRFWISSFSLSISAPLRPMMMPGRAVRMIRRSLLPGRSISTEETPAAFQLFLQLALQVHILDQQLVVIALDEPARAPGLVHAQTKSIRMNFLTHRFLFPRRPALPPGDQTLNCWRLEPGAVLCL